MVSSSVFFSARRDVELFFYRFSLSCLFFAWDAFVSARHHLQFFPLSVFFFVHYLSELLPLLFVAT
jgi:hypothetical protein